MILNRVLSISHTDKNLFIFRNVNHQSQAAITREKTQEMKFSRKSSSQYSSWNFAGYDERANATDGTISTFLARNTRIRWNERLR